MDFTKFVAMLESKCLYFCRVDCLEDPWEGVLSPASREAEVRAYQQVPGGTEEGMRSQLTAIAQIRRTSNFVNCWHESKYESDAMWKLYLRGNEGIAIRTQFGRFRKALEHSAKSIFAGRVRYVDYATAQIPFGNTLQAVLYKRISFEHEREVRAVIMDTGDDNKGLPIEVKIDELIEKIFVAPTAPDWIVSLVEKTARRYGINAPVKRSNLDTKPGG